MFRRVRHAVGITGPSPVMERDRDGYLVLRVVSKGGGKKKERVKAVGRVVVVVVLGGEGVLWA